MVGFAEWLAGMGHRKERRRTVSYSQINNQEQSEIKPIQTLEISFISTQAPSISTPVSALKKVANSDVQYLKQI